MGTENKPESFVLKRILQTELMVLEKLKQLETIISDTDLKRAVEDLVMACKGRYFGVNSLIDDGEDKCNFVQSKELETTLMLGLDRVIVEGILKNIEFINSLYHNELLEDMTPASKKYFEVFKEQTDLQCRNIVELVKEKGFYKDDSKIVTMQAGNAQLNDTAGSVS